MAYLKLVRPLNVSVAAISVLAASFITVRLQIGRPDILISTILACTVVGLVTAGGNVLNDYTDRESDKINHPDRPIPAGLVSPRSALSYSAALFVLSLPLAIIINMECFLLSIINIGILASYESRFKRKGISGNLEISWLTGSIFLFGGLAAYQGNMENLSRTFYLVMLAFFATLGREITKDIQDMRGDTDRETLPRVRGASEASRMAGISFLLAILLSIPPPFLGLMNYIYLAIVLLADIIFLYSMSLIVRDPAGSSKFAKLGMIIALIAFLSGGL